MSTEYAEDLDAGQAAIEAGDLPAAVRHFTRLCEQFPDVAVGYTALGSTLMALDLMEEALPPLRRAVELAPQAAALRNQLGVALYETGDRENAKSAFLAARQADPGDLRSLLNLVDLCREVGDDEGAADVIKAALHQYAGNWQALSAGDAAVEAWDFERAVAEYTRVTEEFPDLAAGHTALGSTLMALERFEDAIPPLRCAAGLVPQSAALQNQLGVALFQSGDLDGAEAAFKAAQEADPEDVQALMNLMDVYRSRAQV